MRVIIEIMHPKHYHQFKNLVVLLIANGHEIQYVARNKDVVFKLLEAEGIDFRRYGRYSSGILGKFLAIPNILSTYNKIISDFRPDVIISKASPYSAILKFVNSYKTAVFPDSEVVFLTNRIVVPISNIVVTPKSFQRAYRIKHLRVNGLFEECYLSPRVFKPNKDILRENGFNPDIPYCLLRFVGWGANHDITQGGLSDEEKIDLVTRLSGRIKVFISSEKNLPTPLEKYALKTPTNLIHHVLSFAEFYIGDSQTMATESALLGTPSIRVNSFVGPNDMSNFINLEKMGFLFNFSNYADVLGRVDEFLADPELKKNWHEKTLDYHTSKLDINKEIFDILTNDI